MQRSKLCKGENLCAVLVASASLLTHFIEYVMDKLEWRNEAEGGRERGRGEGEGGRDEGGRGREGGMEVRGREGGEEETGEREDEERGAHGDWVWIWTRREIAEVVQSRVASMLAVTYFTPCPTRLYP